MEQKKAMWYAIDPDLYTIEQAIDLYNRTKESSEGLFKIRDELKGAGLPADSVEWSLAKLNEAQHMLFMACCKKHAQQMEKNPRTKQTDTIEFKEVHSWRQKAGPLLSMIRNIFLKINLFMLFYKQLM